jgi:hypothetical protein
MSLPLLGQEDKQKISPLNIIVFLARSYERHLNPSEHKAPHAEIRANRAV